MLIFLMLYPYHIFGQYGSILVFVFMDGQNYTRKVKNQRLPCLTTSGFSVLRRYVDMYSVIKILRNGVLARLNTNAMLLQKSKAIHTHCTFIDYVVSNQWTECY